MMSYLWILLLGSLLASHAKAQDEETPAADAEEGTDPAADPEEGTDPAADPEEDTDPAADPEEDTDPAADPEEDTDPAADPEEDTDPAAPAADPEEDTDAAAPAADPDEDTDPAAPDADTDPAAPIPADDAAGDPAPEEDDQAAPAADDGATDADKTPTPTPAVEETTHRPLIPTINEDIIVPDVKADVSFNLADALPPADGNPPQSGKSRSLGNDDKPEVKESSSGSLAGILSAVGVAAVGAVTGYFTYQKKKLCFKNRQEADPEAAHKADAAEAQSDPQVLSNLLNSS